MYCIIVFLEFNSKKTPEYFAQKSFFGLNLTCEIMEISKSEFKEMHNNSFRAHVYQTLINLKICNK